MTEAHPAQPTPSAAPEPTTVGRLRASGHTTRGTKQELRENLLQRLRSGETAFPGIVGFDDSVLPELEGAILAGHDLDRKSVV